jgi:membrane fusion protein (multidrug efflux system)
MGKMARQCLIVLNEAEVSRMHFGVRKKKGLWVFIPLYFIMLAAGCNASKEPNAAPAEVLYSVIGEEKLTLINTLPGRVSALVTAEVRPQVDGIIIERLFEEGTAVKKGQILYRIDSALYRAAYATARASLAEAKASVEAIALLEKRQRILIAQQAVSRQELDDTISKNGQAHARFARAEAELEAAAINLAYTEIKAPVAGRIGASSVTVGALVTANQPSALAVIQQTDRVYVDIMQASTEITRMRRAMAQGKLSPTASAAKVRLTLEDGSPYTAIAQAQTDGEPKWIQGDLLFSEISVGQSTGSIMLRAVFNNPDGILLPGMYVTASIEEGAEDNAVLIPQGLAFVNNAGGHSVYILRKEGTQDGLFRVMRRDVRLERAFGNRWIVSSGLRPGDILMQEGLQKAAPGDLVKGVPLQNTPAGAVPPVRKER